MNKSGPTCNDASADGKASAEDGMNGVSRRSMSFVLMRATLFVALILGVFAGLIQLGIDVGQEKNAVEFNAIEFIESALPAAEEAVYNYDHAFAQRVADGLFTQRAISRVYLSDIDQPMFDSRRDLERTLPSITGFTAADEVVISRDLFDPQDDNDRIGSITVTVDRSIVPPAIVNRLLLYFTLACLKNFILGLVLAGVIYASMARYFIAFTDKVQQWRPGDGPIPLPVPPRFLQDTEIPALADRVSFLANEMEQTLGELKTTAEENAAQLDRERELNALQRQFVAMVSHEFRTPLAIIDGNAQRLLRRAEKVTPERLKKSLEPVRVSVSRLIDLMESVLSVARLESGQIEISLERLSIVDLVQEVSGSYAELHKDSRIMLDLTELPKQIIADEKLTRQVISNIISNAVKYSLGEGQIWINGFVDESERAVVAVRDEGVGIPLAEQEKLFERFFRASTSTGIAGSGIGLHLASHLVQMHGGEIDVESVEGQGTTFFIRLPIAGPLKPQGVREMPPGHTLRAACGPQPNVC